MSLSQYARALRKSWWIVVLLIVLGGAAGYGYSSTKTPLYTSRVTFYVSTPLLGQGNANESNQFAQQRAASYAALAHSDRLAERVQAALSLPIPAHLLTHQISGAAQLNTILVDVTVTDSSQPRAARIAGAVGDQLPKLVAELDNGGGQGSAVKLTVISGPTSSGTPVAPRTRLDVALGLALGLILGLAIAILRELLDVSVRNADTLQELSGVPVLASIGYDGRAKAAPLVVDDGAYSARAEATRHLRTNLQFIDATRPARVVVVTSSVEGEGKSTTAVNLALVVAEANRRVLVIEGDLRKPRVSDYLGLERAVGLSNVLAGQVQVDEVLQIWGPSGLIVLPSGAIPPNPSELLGSDRMVELLEVLRGQFDMIIIDTPPLRPVTDAALLAAYADGAILVFRCGKTRRTQLLVALQSLQSVNARILGCVLNMKPLSRRDRRGYQEYSAESSRASRRNRPNGGDEKDGGDEPSQEWPKTSKAAKTRIRSELSEEEVGHQPRGASRSS